MDSLFSVMFEHRALLICGLSQFLLLTEVSHAPFNTEMFQLVMLGSLACLAWQNELNNA